MRLAVGRDGIPGLADEADAAMTDVGHRSRVDRAHARRGARVEPADLAATRRSPASTVLDDEGDWLRVRGEDGYEGWMHRGFVARAPSERHAAVAQIAARLARLRRPRSSSGRVARASARRLARPERDGGHRRYAIDAAARDAAFPRDALRRSRAPRVELFAGDAAISGAA